MIQNKFGELVFNENDVCNLLMQGRKVESLKNIQIDASINLEKAALLLDCIPEFVTYNALVNQDLTIEEFDRRRQQAWHMPDEYKNMDIAEHVLSLCSTPAELQRCGQELLLYQERNLFDLLKFLKYLIDLTTQQKLILGVGRGSSVASYVLYKLGVHQIDSMYYELDPTEFLR